MFPRVSVFSASVFSASVFSASVFSASASAVKKSEELGARVQAYGVPSQIVLLMPYVITIVVLVISLVSKQKIYAKIFGE